MELFLNRVFATLAAGIDDAVTSVSLTTGHGARFGTIGAGDKVRIVFLDAALNVSEVVYMTGISSDTATIVRGQDGTTATTHAAGDRIEARIGKSTMASMSQKASAGSDAIAETHAATSKATPVDADEFPIADSAAAFILKRVTWANLNATLKTYFDTLYAYLGVTAGKAQQVDQAVAATVRAATTDLTGESLEGTLSDTGVAITAFHGVAGITYKRKCLGAGDITAGAGLTILQGGATIPTAAGDTFEVYLLTATTCEVRNYQRAIDPKTAEIANTTANTANTTANNALAGGHYGQTWQAVTRVAGTTYYNTTGKPIVLSKSFTGTGPTIRVTISINRGTPFDFARHSSGNAATPQIVGNCLIPNGASYLLTETSVASGVSTELR